MRLRCIIFLLLIFSTYCVSGQKREFDPKNLKQAIDFLNKDCPDSLKAIIKITADSALSGLVYPYKSDYRTIFEWTNNDNIHSKIMKYFSKRGIQKYQDDILLITFKQYLLGNNFDEKAIFKPYQDIEKKWAKEDEVRFITDTLRGQYIPKNLEDCFTQINGFWHDTTRLKVKKMTEDEFSTSVHFGFGMWMRNNWFLWGGSRLSKYFNDMGIYHPDDMSGIILDSYHRFLNHKELKLEEQVKHYQDFWENSKKQELSRKKDEFTEYIVGDTVFFLYRKGFTSEKQEEEFDNEKCIAKGRILEKDEKKFWIKVLLIDACDDKGIIYDDNEGSKIYNKKTKRFEPPKKRVIKRLKKGRSQWFEYSDWEKVDI
jgi:hypothetical protein